MTEGLKSLKNTEMAMVVLAEDELANYSEAMRSGNTDQWKQACENEYEILGSYCP